MAFIKINKQNFYHNLNQIVLQTGSVDKIAIVLKDNAYGHGLEHIATLASEFGITYAVVRDHIEAAQIEAYFQTIIVLNDTARKHSKCTYVINSIEAINNAEKGAKVELKIDTGMHRNGITMHSLEDALERIEKQELKLVGVMTHYRSADVLSSELFWQQKQFEEVKQRVKKAGYTTVRFHSYNSAATLRTKHFNEDLVRVGIGAYGYNELPDSFDKIALKPVLSLYAKKISTRTLAQGQCVGYGGDFIAPKTMRVSTYDLGYGDGWCRGDSNQPFLTAENLPILGRVSMDSLSLESEQEKVCIMNNAQNAAKQWGTISYEVTTALSKDIQREII